MKNIRWGWILLGGFLAELAVFVVVIPLSLLAGQDSLLYSAPPASFAATFVFGIWVARKAPQRRILHGALVGVAATLVLTALAFDFVNGFHDASNSLATVVATRVLTPVQAVVLAAVFNFLAAAFLGTAVAATIGTGFVNTRIVTPFVIFAGLIRAVAWNLLTWYLKLPVSSSHALIGGYAGAAVAKAGVTGLVLGKWPSTLLFIVAGPVIGLLLGYLFMLAVYWLFEGFSPVRMDRWFRHLQILSASLLSCAHGTNDAQKSMGIITAVLFAAGFEASFRVPRWVILACAAAMGLGTLSGAGGSSTRWGPA